MKNMRLMPDFYEKHALKARFSIRQNAPQPEFLDKILMGTLSY